MTDPIAIPRSRSIVEGIPSPIASACGQAATACAQLGLELVEQLVEVTAVGALGRPVKDLLRGVDHPDRHLGPAEIRPDRGPHGAADRQEFGPGMRY